MRVEFGLNLYKQNNSNFVFIEKDSKGEEQRYLQGISSGALFVDAHNERMSERCIKGFQWQALNKTIYLLHPHTEDLLSNHIGILIAEKSFIDEKLEWKTTFRLWKESDIKNGIPQANIEKAIDFYNQITGQGVYKKPTAIKQLSVQGLFDEQKDLKIENGTRIIDWVELDGVCVVTKGAYPQDNFTVAQKIIKQLNTKNKISIKNKIAKENSVEDFYINEWKLEDKFNDTKQEILTNPNLSNEEKKQLLDQLLEERKVLEMKNLEIINYTLEESEGKMNKKKNINKNIDEEVDALTDATEPEVINKSDEEGEETEGQGNLILTPEMLDQLVEKVVAKMQYTQKQEDEESMDEVEKEDGEETETEEVEKSNVSKEADDDGLASGEPSLIKEDEENIEKEETDPDIEKVAKKLGLSKKQKDELYLQKAMKKLPKQFVNALEKSNSKIEQLEKQVNILVKKNQYLTAGQEAIVDAFLNEEQPKVVNKIAKSFVKKDGLDNIVKDNVDTKQVNTKNYDSFKSIRNVLKEMY